MSGLPTGDNFASANPHLSSTTGLEDCRTARPNLR